jgi:hypothetical protein
MIIILEQVIMIKIKFVNLIINKFKLFINNIRKIKLILILFVKLLINKFLNYNHFKKKINIFIILKSLIAK